MIRQISQSVFARRFFLKTIHCGLTKRVRWGILKLRKRWISCTTDTKGKIPLERTAFSLLGDFPAWGVLTAYRSIHQATCRCRNWLHFSCIKSAKMMSQQLDKVWSLGYTKTAKAMSRLHCWHKRKNPPWENCLFSLGGFSCVGRAYRLPKYPSSHLQM